MRRNRGFRKTSEFFVRFPAPLSLYWKKAVSNHETPAGKIANDVIRNELIQKVEAGTVIEFWNGSRFEFDSETTGTLIRKDGTAIRYVDIDFTYGNHGGFTDDGPVETLMLGIYHGQWGLEGAIGKFHQGYGDGYFEVFFGGRRADGVVDPICEVPVDSPNWLGMDGTTTPPQTDTDDTGSELDVPPRVADAPAAVDSPTVDLFEDTSGNAVHRKSDTVIALDQNDFESPTELADALTDHIDSDATPWSLDEGFVSSNRNEGLEIELEPSLLDLLYSDIDLFTSGS